MLPPLQMRSYNRHTLVADPYEDGFGDFLLKKQKMIELEKKVERTGQDVPLFVLVFFFIVFLSITTRLMMVLSVVYLCCTRGCCLTIRLINNPLSELHETALFILERVHLIRKITFYAF